MNKKQIFGALVATTLVTLMATVPTMAQDTTTRDTDNATRTAASNQQPDRDTNWGWLGLLGLAGLAGLRRPNQTVVREDRDGGARAY